MASAITGGISDIVDGSNGSGPGSVSTFHSNVRKVVMIVLFLVATLTLQNSVSDLLQYYVTSMYAGATGKRWISFAFAFLLLGIVIIVMMVWRDPAGGSAFESRE